MPNKLVGTKARAERWKRKMKNKGFDVRIRAASVKSKNGKMLKYKVAWSR